MDALLKGQVSDVEFDEVATDTVTDYFQVGDSNRQGKTAWSRAAGVYKQDSVFVCNMWSMGMTCYDGSKACSSRIQVHFSNIVEYIK